jgi:hypothetical protein
MGCNPGRENYPARMKQLAGLLLAFVLARTACAENVVIFVDGIDPTATMTGFNPLIRQFNGPSPNRVTNYLEASSLGFALTTELPAKGITIQWNGDVSDTETLRKTVGELQAAILDASRNGDPVFLVTHSMGTVVGYLALLDLVNNADPDASYTGVQYFVTLASPLSKDLLLQGLNMVGSNATLGIPRTSRALLKPQTLRIREHWINAYSAGDIIGATSINIADVENIDVPGCPIELAPPVIANVCAHAHPYLHYETIRRLLAELASHSK